MSTRFGKVVQKEYGEDPLPMRKQVSRRRWLDTVDRYICMRNIEQTLSPLGERTFDELRDTPDWEYTREAGIAHEFYG